MTAADVPREMALSAMDSLSDELGLVRVGVHDTSRLEWSVSLRLPDDGPVDYSIDVELQIPGQARHSPWDQMQSFTRLDGPALGMGAESALDIDGLRRGAVAVANKLARSSDGFARDCRLAASLFAAPPQVGELTRQLHRWLNIARAVVRESRAQLVAFREEDTRELARERELADEFISVRLLELFAGAERSLRGVADSKSPHLEALKTVIGELEQRVADSLGEELGYRHDHAWIEADPSSVARLEAYVERASRLKKHFQQVLFLEPETFQVADRIHHWVAAFVAVLASTWAFAWQIALMNQAPTTGTQVGSGIVFLAVIAGVVYATKDRIKELGRTWISGHVHRIYAQRVARFRAPARRLPTRDVIVSARESIDQVVTTIPDALNPHAGATLPATVVHYVHKGRIFPQRQLAESGVRRIKHVYRYDLSPLFARLDDAVKPVPVLDAVTRRVRFIDAPRCYRIPVRIRVRTGRREWDDAATLVLHKRGLDRLERNDEVEAGFLEGTGLEP